MTGVILALLVLLVLCLYLLFPSVFWRVESRMFGTYRPSDSEYFDGIDVSHHNGVIDWQRVAATKKVGFAYIKATEGYRHPDKRYDDNIEGARKAGIKAGSYHLLTTRFDMRTQFEYFTSIVDRNKQDIIPMVDIEENKVTRWSRKQLQDSLAKFLRLAEDYYGSEPVIYCSYRFYKQKLAPRFNNSILFLARYSKLPPKLDEDGRTHDIWQFTEHGTVDGIEGDVDLNRFGPNTTINDISF